MTSRRSFIKTGSLLSASLLFRPSLYAAGKKTIGLQLYTVRDAMQQDARATLARVAAIGYNSVEGASYGGSQLFYGMDAKTFSSVLKQNGLIIPSGHYGMGLEKSQGEYVKGTILHEWNKAVDDAAAVGMKYMVCAYLSEKERQPDRYKQLAEDFNKAGETCKKSGIQFCYHNHNFEFVPQNGQMLYDVLVNDTDKELVKMQLDLYWATKAGQDPVALFEKHPGRFPLWHVKDMNKQEPHGFTEVGYGSIDFKRIFAHAATSGMKYFFVEEDICPGSPFDSVKKSYDYIHDHLV